MVITEIRLIVFFAAKDEEALQSQQKQEWELIVAQIMNSLLQNTDLNWRKSMGSHRVGNDWSHLAAGAGKTTRPFRNDVNQIPYDYTVEMTSRFKGLDLIECLKNYGWRFMTLYRKQGSRPSPRKRNARRQNGCLRRDYKPTTLL